jgi:hypothetical protein
MNLVKNEHACSNKLFDLHLCIFFVYFVCFVVQWHFGF